MILNTRHTGIVVQDLDRAIRFYEGLGLCLWRREMETGAFIEQVTGLPDVRLEWAKLKVPDETKEKIQKFHETLKPTKTKNGL